MKVLIIKLNATGDVVRTTPLLRRLPGEITWVTARNNMVLLHQLAENLFPFSWEDRDTVLGIEYDLVINLEDDADVAAFVQQVRYKQLFGAHINGQNTVSYTEDSCRWFDLSLISVYGRKRADQLKFQNRCAYQQLIFDGLGLHFEGEKYLLPETVATDLSGDVAIAPVAGAVWPMKNWAHYDQLQRELEAKGLKVNVLPKRGSLLEHLADVRNHRLLVGGDSLPMHLALGSEVPCVTLFTCTSPWEIYDYGIQTKIVSPLLGEFFYSRGFDARATTAIGVEEVFSSVMAKISSPSETDSSR
ncbi:MAG: hypothetical protein JO279_15550 [Verrucomicrobia bacterium]|nr:hypothetical protein [Verrucomicrobiota bacterium]